MSVIEELERLGLTGRRLSNEPPVTEPQSAEPVEEDFEESLEDVEIEVAEDEEEPVEEAEEEMEEEEVDEPEPRFSGPPALASLKRLEYRMEKAKHWLAEVSDAIEEVKSMFSRGEE